MKNFLIVALLIGLSMSSCVSKKLLNKPIDTNKFTVIELGKDSLFFVITFKDGRKAFKSKPLFQTAGFTNLSLSMNDILEDEYQDISANKWIIKGVGDPNCIESKTRDGKPVTNCNINPPVELNKAGLIGSGPVIFPPPDDIHGILSISIFIKFKDLPHTFKDLIHKR